ncbi:MAG: hypothetical protein AAGJ35_09720, partial [Myxococcota bacterium]
ATPQSDLYSVGIILWELLCQQALYTQPHAAKQHYGTRIPPRQIRPEIPHELSELTLWALEPNATQRLPNTTTFAHALAQIRTTLPEAPPLQTLFQNLAPQQDTPPTQTLHTAYNLNHDKTQ